jgi:capsular polysaccharide biosynthesis protein
VRIVPTINSRRHNGEREDVLSLGVLLQTVSQRAWAIALGVVLIVGFTLSFTIMQQPLYEASTTMLVTQGNSTPGSLGNDVVGLQKTTPTMANLINNRRVAERVVRQLDLQITPQELLNHLKVEAIFPTQLLRITYEDPSAQRAAQVVSAYGNEFSKEASDVLTNANGVTATVWDQAAVPDRPASPNFVLNLCLALVVGLAFGVAAAFLEALSGDWRSPKNVWRVSEPLADGDSGGSARASEGRTPTY